jgi:hypothetical protein
VKELVMDNNKGYGAGEIGLLACLRYVDRVEFLIHIFIVRLTPRVIAKKIINGETTSHIMPEGTLASAALG